MNLEHNETHIQQNEWVHKTTGQCSVKGVELIVLQTRNPIDRWKSINRRFSGRTAFQLLRMGLCWIMERDVEIPVELIRYESLERDFKRLFRLDIGKSNIIDKPSPEPTIDDLKLIRGVNRLEWDLYKCEKLLS